MFDLIKTPFKLLFAPAEALKSGGYYNEGIGISVVLTEYIGAFMKTYGACNVTFEEVKANIVKLWQVSNIMVTQ